MFDDDDEVDDEEDDGDVVDIVSNALWLSCGGGDEDTDEMSVVEETIDEDCLIGGDCDCGCCCCGCCC